jgi:hypothetical protein
MSVRQQSFESVQRGQQGPTQPEEALTEYRRRKLELGELIRGAMNLVSERHDERRKESARELLARVADDRFQLAVVGQFSRQEEHPDERILSRRSGRDRQRGVSHRR